MRAEGAGGAVRVPRCRRGQKGSEPAGWEGGPEESRMARKPSEGTEKVGCRERRVLRTSE